MGTTGVTSFIVIVLLLVANGFFVAAEFALVKARGVRIETMANDGSFAAKLTVRIQGNLEAYLAACQLGITMASLGLGWVGEPAVEALLRPVLEPMGLSDATLHTVSFLLGFILFSSLHIVIGEQVPKTYAIRKPEPVSVLCAIPLHAFYLMFYPLNSLLHSVSAYILRMLGVEEAPHVDILSGTEIQGIVSSSAEHGELGEEKAQMIHNLFRFDERSVGRVMIPRVECDVLNLEHPVEENIKIMKETRHSRFPVVKGDNENLVGIVLMKDLVDAVLAGDSEPWRDLQPYCREPLVVPETLKVSRLFDTMREDKAHMACIVDEYGTFTGLVTMEDLLEEIVGEIIDETDEDTEDFPIVESENGWLVHGLTSLANVERDTGFAVADTFNANTISGLFMNKLERMPAVDDVVIDGRFKITVTEVKDRRVETARIERIDEDREPAGDNTK